MHQETQLSLTNRATRLEVSQRLKKFISVSPFKVTQGHRNRHGSIRRLRLPINVP